MIRIIKFSDVWHPLHRISHQLQHLQLRLLRLRRQRREALREEPLRRHRRGVDLPEDEVWHFSGKHNPVRSEHRHGAHSGPGLPIWSGRRHPSLCPHVGDEGRLPSDQENVVLWRISEVKQTVFWTISIFFYVLLLLIALVVLTRCPKWPLPSLWSTAPRMRWSTSLTGSPSTKSAPGPSSPYGWRWVQLRRQSDCCWTALTPLPDGLCLSATLFFPMSHFLPWLPRAPVTTMWSCTTSTWSACGTLWRRRSRPTDTRPHHPLLPLLQRRPEQPALRGAVTRGDEDEEVKKRSKRLARRYR